MGRLIFDLIPLVLLFFSGITIFYLAGRLRK